MLINIYERLKNGKKLKDFGKYDDKQLIALIHVGGNELEGAFKEVYNRYSKRMFSYCRMKCTIMPDAEDIFQDMWLIFCNTVKQGKVDIELPHYLFGIARNLILQKGNKDKKFNSSIVENPDLDFIISPNISLEASLEKQDLIQIIKIASCYLNEKQKETFYLKWFIGLTSSEISQITGDSIDSIKQRSHRTMDKVLKILEPFIKDSKK